MATSNYFNHYNHFSEQELLTNLIIESIRQYGVDCYYIPRNLHNQDDVYEEDSVSTFNKAVMLEMYVKSIDGFTGEGNFLSKFGLEIRNQIIFTVAARTYENEVGPIHNMVRPREGDLIYFPLNAKSFEIKYVENKPYFYQLGTLPSYDLHCELYEYSSEVFETGIDEIDEVQLKHSTNILDYALLTEDGYQITTQQDEIITTQMYELESFDPLADNDQIQADGNVELNFDEENPFGDQSY